MMNNHNPIRNWKFLLTLLWRRLLSCRNQSIDLLPKSMDWFLYDNGLRHERAKRNSAVLQKVIYQKLGNVRNVGKHGILWPSFRFWVLGQNQKVRRKKVGKKFPRFPSFRPDDCFTYIFFLNSWRHMFNVNDKKITTTASVNVIVVCRLYFWRLRRSFY